MVARKEVHLGTVAPEDAMDFAYLMERVNSVIAEHEGKPMYGINLAIVSELIARDLAHEPKGLRFLQLLCAAVAEDPSYQKLFGDAYRKAKYLDTRRSTEENS